VEHCLALLLALSKQLLVLDRETRRGNFAIRYRNLPRDLQDGRLGVVGFGRIGSLFAEKCHRLFSMRIIACDPLLPQERKKEYTDWVTFTTLDKVCREADALTVHVPANADTRGMIGHDQFRRMKPHALLINASRGGVVNEGDLIIALQEGVIGGAGLDVFEKEPVGTDSPLLGMDNVVLTPHAAALTEECVVRMAVSAAQRVIDVFNGFLPDNVANPEVIEQQRWRHLKPKP
jgi:D-3-phosphoglycerate dehydrogenase